MAGGPEADPATSPAPPARHVSGRNWGDEAPQEQAASAAAPSVAPPSRRQSTLTKRMSVSLLAESKAPAAAAPPVRLLKGPKKAPRSSFKGGRATGNTASTFQGKKTVRLSVLPVGAGGHSDGFAPSLAGPTSAVSFAPKRLLDIENGKSILITNQAFLDHHRFQELDEGGAIVVTAKGTAPIAQDTTTFFKDRGALLKERIQSGDIRDFDSSSENGMMGDAWRGALRRLMLFSLDDVNGLRLGRVLQLSFPFLTAYESYIMSQLVEALDEGSASKADVEYVLRVAFHNRNVSRTVVQNLGPRWDFFWHWYRQVIKNRRYDAWGQLPIVGISSFPATENFPSTRNHALSSIFRVLLGQGTWVSRVLTGGRQGLNTDNPDKNIAQNLAAESNGFEVANRNQFGNYFGRMKTNEFRIDHRLPTDESLVRTFVAQPMPTLINNGVVHCLRWLSKHWHNMLTQPSGNFAHQRMEQLDPFETMRFHMPVICVTLASLRGRNKWDAEVLGPFLKKCQELKPSIDAKSCKALVKEMQEDIVSSLSGGIAMVADPLRSLLDAIMQSCEMIEVEAQEVYQQVSGVEIGLRLGHDLITQVSWQLPSEAELKAAILAHIRGTNPGPLVSERRIRKAMILTTPRDKRTLIELVKNGLANSNPAQLLLSRVKTLLQREIRRENLNEAIRELSMGDEVQPPLKKDEWYWVEEGPRKGVYIYDAKVTGKDSHRFIHVDSGAERFLSINDGYCKFRTYVPIAEAIARAQKCYMDIELDHGKRFKYSAFMEFTYLRIALRRLAVISQVFCEEIDNARLNVLREVQRSNQVQVSVHELEVGVTYYTYDGKTKSYEPFVCEKQYTSDDPEWTSLARTKIVKVPPQSTIVVGGGPTGLMTVVHCTEAVVVSGGVMKLFEARDAFATGGSTFERAQIVRLDARWIAMLRYHLGTGFEDIYIPASGETDAQLGNTLPTQGFVEITIKDLENMLHVEVSKLWSKGLIQCFTNSKAKYDVASNSLTKSAEALKIDDKILRRVDPEGRPSKEYYSWKIVDLVHTQALGPENLVIGKEYAVYIRTKNAVLPFKLVGIDLDTRTYTFKSAKKGVQDLKAQVHNLPAVYPKGTTRHEDINKIVIESVQKEAGGGYHQDELPMAVVRKQNFTLDLGHTHVVECIGKPHGSKVHFSVTTYEPYGVCCISGLKISMGMHNFGEKRFGSGLMDDFRSINDQNTRIIGDFTKMVRQRMVATRMYELIQTDNWIAHFKSVVAESKYPSLNELDPVIPKITEGVKWHAENAPDFKRQTLQTRFFETGDNYYLGMEFTREYDTWKNELATSLVAGLQMKSDMSPSEKKDVGRLRGTFCHHIDRLWYEACLAVIHEGDVYNPGARGRVPHLWLTKSYFDQTLGELPVGDGFRLAERPEDKYEVIIKKGKQIIVRNIEGHISKMPKATKVRRESDLTRAPNGNRESRVSLATFPVGHYVNFRTIRLNREDRGYVFTFVGDEQATPHFMRYSGLTGACINAMLFNNFIKQANNGSTFADRFQLYSKETNWSNGEVVARGTSTNFGEDGFLRPGFPYAHGLDYLHSKVIEYMETGQDPKALLSRDWKHKFASSMIPRGMELNKDFISVLYAKMHTCIFNKFITEVKADKSIDGDALADSLMKRKDEMEGVQYDRYWTQFASGLEGLDDETMGVLSGHCEIAECLELTVEQIVQFATDAYLNNERAKQELYYQPKPVDSIVDDFAVEAQNFANSLMQSAAFAAGTLAFSLTRSDAVSNVGGIFASIISALNILISFGTMANVMRYKIRNEETRILFFDKQFLNVKKAVFGLMSKDAQDAVPAYENPIIIDLEDKVKTFLFNAEYYNFDEPKEFKDAYETLKMKINDPEAILEFMKLLSSHFIADIYHVSSYLQEDLVNIYKACDGMYVFLTQEVKAGSGVAEAKHLFERLIDFTPVLDDSMQRGHIYGGFLKTRKFAHWDICVVFRYFWSLICCARAGGKTPLAPIQTETLGICKETASLSSLHSFSVLRREVRDLQQLYWATRESDVASLIFCSASLVFLSSWVFTISRIITKAGGSDTVTEVAFWAVVASAFGAILAAFHFVRKFLILLGLFGTLFKKKRAAKTREDKAALGKVISTTFTQIALTFVRLCAALAAGVALPFSVAQQGFADEIGTDEDLPFWIALGAFCASVGGVIFFFMVEYVTRYTLSPKLGEFVCEAFREEIEHIYAATSVPLNDIDAKQIQEREAWEYTAREFLHKYRFDTVFAADRFGAIMQYIQGGMERRE